MTSSGFCLLNTVAVAAAYARYQYGRQAFSNYVNQNEIDLLVVFPKKHSWFEQIFEKSKTRQLIQASIKPILCLRN
jgi:hypothetical protein